MMRDPQGSRLLVQHLSVKPKASWWEGLVSLLGEGWGKWVVLPTYNGYMINTHIYIYTHNPRYNNWDHHDDEVTNHFLSRIYRLASTPFKPLRLVLIHFVDGTARELGILHCHAFGLGSQEDT